MPEQQNPKSEEKENITENNNEEKNDKKIRKQIAWILGVMIGLILLFLATHWFFQSLTRFEYNELAFTIEKTGSATQGWGIKDTTTVYHHYYYFDGKNGKTIKYNLYLLNDPRKNDIPVEGEIHFSKDRRVYLSINSTGLQDCPRAPAAIGTITFFLLDNDIPTKAATPDQEKAKELNLTYTTCETNPNADVVIIQSGKETRITKIKEHCYTMDVANCELTEAIEKFQVQAIIDARARQAAQQGFAAE